MLDERDMQLLGNLLDQKLDEKLSNSSIASTFH